MFAWFKRQIKRIAASADREDGSLIELLDVWNESALKAS